MNLVQLLLIEPVVAVLPHVDRTFHAVTADGIPAKDWPDVTLTTACGIKGVKLVESADVDGYSVRWPVPSRLPEGLTRCRTCWEATGKQRPRARVQMHR